jgi:hypothetical protein
MNRRNTPINQNIVIPDECGKKAETGVVVGSVHQR